MAQVDAPGEKTSVCWLNENLKVSEFRKNKQKNMDMDFSILIISFYMHTEEPGYLYLCVHDNYTTILVSGHYIIVFAGACDVYFLQHEL